MTTKFIKTQRGRGVDDNPRNRFEALELDWDEEERFDNPKQRRTQFYHDHSKTLLSYNKSPDIGMGVSLNPYRGCEHGCVYCYARPTHEYLGFSSGLDFESKIMVKSNAPELLRKEFSKPKWQPQIVMLSGNTDCYQPIEKKLELTRACLQVFLEFKNPVAVITKNSLITRDIDILKQLAQHNLVNVRLSVTTLDPELARQMEPRTAMPQARLRAIAELTQAGIPTGIMMAPIIPAITESEIPAVLQATSQAGAQWANYVMLRLPHANKELWENWLSTHFADRKQKVLNRLRSLRDGKLYNAHFSNRMTGKGVYADEVKNLFKIYCQKYHLNQKPHTFNTSAFQRPNQQLHLF